MEFDYHGFYDFSGLEEIADAMGPMIVTVLIIMLSFFLAMMLVSIALYVLRSIGTYTIAKRRGIHHPWLAWIPVGEAWVLGSISDQYQYVVKGKIRSRRKVLLGISIGMNVLSFLTMIVQTVTMIAWVGDADSVGVPLAIAACSLILGVAGIVYMVFYYISQYDMYRSCDPSNATVFLVLGIFFSVLQWIFPFVCRKKDFGMPPRRTQSAPEPAAISEQTEPAPAEPAEAPAQPEMSCDSVAEDTDFVDAVTDETPASDEKIEE